MHYTQSDILNTAVDIGEGYRLLTVVLRPGDTAYSGVSTKYSLAGPGTVEYLIAASGWQVSPSDTVTRSYK